MDRSYKALADPTRRRILALLRDRDMTAGNIAGHFPVAWPSVSHHLGILKEAGLVMAERDGQHIRYSINTTIFQELVQHLLQLMPNKSKGGRHA